jgi:FtsP/CotA-like multicopper oxidase with cupredoxin domain
VGKRLNVTTCVAFLGSVWAVVGLTVLSSPVRAQDPMPMNMPGMQHDMGNMDPNVWRMPPMEGMDMSMMPYLEGNVPTAAPFMPGMDLTDMQRSMLPEATYREVVQLADGDVLELEAGLVRRNVGGHDVIMYAFNGQYPGPVIKVEQHSTITVNFTNNIEFPTTLRWHGVRVDNRYDGVPGLTQRPVRPGNTFEYQVRFPDAGTFWYHPHQREEVAQDLGLYGNIIVESPDEDYYSPVNHEVVLMLDDILMDAMGPIPWGFEAPTHVLMGRFGNVMLVDGKESHELAVKKGDVVRYHLTNASNTRMFNLSWGGAPIKLVAGDLSKFEREVMVHSVVIAPGQRYVVEVKFDEPGEASLTSRIQAINHFLGQFYPTVDTLGTVTVADENTDADYSAAFAELREPADVAADIDAMRPYFDREVDKELELTLNARGLLTPIQQMMAIDTFYVPPLEWNETMPMMNWLATGQEVTWILPDVATMSPDRELGPARGWRFKEGDVIKLRLFNNPKSVHPMNHPMHLHGQRFLVLEQDGVRMSNLVWRDTVIVPVGATIDLLVEMSNPGDWMLNCQIPEHVGSGMSISMKVDPAP